MISPEEFLIYVVEDELFAREMLVDSLAEGPNSYPSKGFSDIQSLKKAVSEEAPSVITLDYHLPVRPGGEPEDLDINLLKEFKQQHPHMEIIIISKQPKIEIAISLIQSGAYDYITKSEDIAVRLENTLNNIRQQKSVRAENKLLKKELSGDYQEIIGESPAIKELRAQVEKVAVFNQDVLLIGETGVGKEVIARAIHRYSLRKEEILVTVNMAAIPETLAESELFGYEKGAFTGAHQSRPGKFELSHNGTIFLDELGEASPEIQAKILRTLENGEVSRLGGLTTKKVDCRVIAATNVDLQKAVSDGNFRKDLFFRLGFTLAIPPLRERGSDILLLSTYFLERFCRENNIDQLAISGEAQEKLLRYPYPGNVRELKNIIERAAIMSTHQHQEIPASTIQFGGSEEKLLEIMQEASFNDYKEFIYEYFLRKYDGNVAEVSAHLGITGQTLYRYIKKRDNSS